MEMGEEKIPSRSKMFRDYIKNMTANKKEESTKGSRKTSEHYSSEREPKSKEDIEK